jgi:hypothetical protein
MDFSQFNAAEQAQISKVLERKQVSRVDCFSLSSWLEWGYRDVRS